MATTLFTITHDAPLMSACLEEIWEHNRAETPDAALQILRLSQTLLPDLNERASKFPLLATTFKNRHRGNLHYVASILKGGPAKKKYWLTANTFKNNLAEFEAAIIAEEEKVAGTEAVEEAKSSELQMMKEQLDAMKAEISYMSERLLATAAVAAHGALLKGRIESLEKENSALKHRISTMERILAPLPATTEPPVEEEAEEDIEVEIVTIHGNRYLRDGENNLWTMDYEWAGKYLPKLDQIDKSAPEPVYD
jgi:hypothetical protein